MYIDLILWSFCSNICGETPKCEICKIMNYSYSQIKDLFKKAKTKEEKDFYMTLANMMQQREQAKIIGK